MSKPNLNTKAKKKLYKEIMKGIKSVPIITKNKELVALAIFNSRVKQLKKKKV